MSFKTFCEYILQEYKNENDVDALMHSKVKDKPVKNFKGDYTKLSVSAPSKNSSRATYEEMEEMKKMFPKRTPEMEQSVKDHDAESGFAIKKYLDENDLEYSEEEMDKIKDVGSGIVRHFKNKFQRPRPYHLADNMKMEFDFMPLHSDSMKSPAYPSGHSLQSRLLANYYSKKYPNHKEGLIKAAEECGMGRVYSGWHYPSDHDASVKLANEVSPKIQMDMDEAYKRDYKAEYKKFQSSPERIAYRAALVKYNRDKGTYGNGDGLDASHKGDKIVGFEKESKNRGRAEKSRLKGSVRNVKADVGVRG